MKAMKCDRCNEYYGTGIEVYSKKGIPFEHILVRGFGTESQIDLCPACRKSFDLWLKEGLTNE